MLGTPTPRPSRPFPTSGSMTRQTSSRTSCSVPSARTAAVSTRTRRPSSTRPARTFVPPRSTPMMDKSVSSGPACRPGLGPLLPPGPDRLVDDERPGPDADAQDVAQGQVEEEHPLAEADEIAERADDRRHEGPPDDAR